MRLMRNDLVMMELDDTRTLMRLCKVAQSKQMFFAPHNEANVDARNRDKNDDFQYVSKMPSSLQKTNARYVTVSPIGDMKVYR